VEIVIFIFIFAFVFVLYLLLYCRMQCSAHLIVCVAMLLYARALLFLFIIKNDIQPGAFSSSACIAFSNVLAQK